MAQFNPSFDSFHQGVVSRLNAIVEATDTALDSFAAYGKGDQSTNAVRTVENFCSQLMDYLAAGHRPDWLPTLLSESQRCLRDNNASACERWVRKVSQIRSSMVPIDPYYKQDDDEPAIDFDQIYEQFRNAGQLPRLFDEMISIVSNIIESGHVDSIKALGALKDLLAFLKANRDGSLVSVWATLFSADFLWNFAKETIQEFPVFKQAITAYEKTKAETDDELTKVQEEIRDQTLKALRAALPQPKQMPYFDQAALESDADAIEGELIETNQPTAAVNALTGEPQTQIVKDQPEP